jgi:hypothetical protein
LVDSIYPVNSINLINQLIGPQAQRSSSKGPGPEGPALIIPGGDLVYRHLTIYGVLAYWRDGVMDDPPFSIAFRKQTPGENLKV